MNMQVSPYDLTCLHCTSIHKLKKKNLIFILEKREIQRKNSSQTNEDANGNDDARYSFFRFPLAYRKK